MKTACRTAIVLEAVKAIRLQNWDGDDTIPVLPNADAVK